MSRKLTDKQQRFVEEYLLDLNATQACIRAGYKAKNARQQGTENLAKPVISEEIAKRIAERSRRTGINQDRVIQELARIAFVKITDVVDSNGEINRNASEDDIACIESYKVEDSDSINGSSSKREVKLASKLKALELLGKHLGMFTDKVDVEVVLPVFGGEEDLEE